MDTPLVPSSGIRSTESSAWIIPGRSGVSESDQSGIPPLEEATNLREKGSSVAPGEPPSTVPSRLGHREVIVITESSPEEALTLDVSSCSRKRSTGSTGSSSGSAISSPPTGTFD